MGAGGEGGSHSTAMVSATKQATSMLIHKMQREELLDADCNAPVDLSSSKQSPNLTTRTRPPRAGNTPIQSPRSMSPLRGLSSTEVVSSEIASATLVDFQEAILRASQPRKAASMVENYSFHEEVMDFQLQKISSEPSSPADGEQNEAPPVVAAAVTRSKSVISGPPHSRHKSPFPPGRVRSSGDMDQETAPAIRGTRNADATQPSEWVLLERGKSPRRSKVNSSSSGLQNEPQELPAQRKSSRNSSRQSKVESSEDLPDADLGMGDANRATRRSHTRAHTRQHKRKASEAATVITGLASPPESYAVHQSPLLHQRQQPPEYQPPSYRVEQNSAATVSPSTSSRRASREARTMGSSDWLQFIGDIIMWRHIPRSALLFGAGCFCIMSASLVQDMQYRSTSTISILAYVALFYLSARFIKCNFLRSSTQTLSVVVLTEADVLSLIRVLLPPFNIVLQKLGDLFCGEPMVTLKVAGALWFLARAGSMMNVWTLMKIAYFALFTVPKCYSCYNEQLKAQARNVLHWMQTTWIACGHKKAVMFTGFAIAWNFSSVSTRICGAFLVLVSIRAYQHVIRSELEAGSSSFFNQDRRMRMIH